MNWPVVSLDSIKAEEKYSLVGGPFGSNLTTKDYIEEGVPVIRGVNLPDARKFMDDGFVFVSVEKADKLMSNNAFPGDVIFTQRGTLGQVGIIPRTTARFSRYVISQSQMKLTVNTTKAIAEFVYYFFRSPSTVQTVKNLALTSGVPHINLEILKNFKLPLPPLDIQRRIVATLATYDSLIENNQRRMELLEETARQLYREWFVRLRFPGYEHTRIVDGVSEGWERGIIADFFDTTSGGTPNRKNPDFYTGDINWVKTQELNNDFIFETEEKITEEALQKSSAKLFPINTVLVSIYGGTNIGRTAILAKPAATNQACCAIFPKNERTHFIFAYLFFREMRDELIGLAQGAAQTNISQQTIRRLPIIVPPYALMRSFVDCLEPVFAQMCNLKQQNAKLRIACDLLLPKLLSGDITV